MTASTPPSKQIGSYPIEREIGRGGMGIVYLGRDSRLDRPVAIKVLPDVFAGDPDRLARFEREARLLASLSHPNIAAIHGLEESAGRRFLVLEYVEGETLHERIARGPMPVDDAAEVCARIAAALEAAHERGVIHRDLKPGNVKLTHDGDVKVLDFGLAKGGVGSGAASDPSISASPTVSQIAATGAGVILGTAAYMSPEQARGKALDRRTDIWSFGCVLYECLTGRQAFIGETVSDLIAQILQGEPDWKALPANTPPRLRELLARCLTKDPKKRLRDIGEARLLLEGDSSQASGVFAASPPARASRAPWLLATLFALSTAALAALLILRAPEPSLVRRVTVGLPPIAFAPRDPAFAALSPDGTRIASLTADTSGTSWIWVRPLDRLEGRLLPGTEDAGAYPAWSPDGHSLLFSTQDQLKKIDLRGGSAEVICPVSGFGRGASWGTRGNILLSRGAEGPIHQVSAEGGVSTPATTLAAGETGHRFPHFLPDGRHFLYVSLPPHGNLCDVWLASTDDSKQRLKLLEADGTPQYVEPGWLLYTRNGRTFAHRYDAGARRLSGKPIVLPDEPKRSDNLGASSLVAGRRGPIAYFPVETGATRLMWNQFGGEREALPLPAGPYETAVLSPDGGHVLLVRRSGQSESDLWLLDLGRMVQTRLTFGAARVDRPVWSHDGSRVAYSSNPSGRWDVFVKSVGASGAAQTVFESGSVLKYASGFTPDGRKLLVEQIGEDTGWDFLEVSLDGSGEPRAVHASRFDEKFASVSPDGRWLSYTTNESGRFEVFVDSYPEPGRRTQISTAGGSNSTWSADGRELSYLTGLTTCARITFDPATGRTVGRPQTFSMPSDVSASFAQDLRRALVLVPVESARVTDDITLVDHWRSELKPR